MRKPFLCATMLVGVMFGTADAIAAHLIELVVSLDTDQADPPPTLNGATPSGSATLNFDPVTGDISVSGSYSGTTSNVGAAHLHGLAAPGDNAGVIFGFDVTGGTDGTFEGSSVLSTENLAGFLAGNAYLNLHTANNGAGELRAQVPEPASRLMLLFGVAALASISRGFRSK